MKATLNVSPVNFETQAIAIMNRLEVSPKAVDIKAELSFLLSKGMDAETNFDGLKGVKLLTALSNERKKLIDASRIESFQSFAQQFNNNPKSALESLFLEHFSTGKMVRFVERITNLEAMFSIHSTNRYVWAMQLVEEI